MSNFDSAIKVVLLHEGGWVDDPNDLGGETNFGVSIRFIKAEGLTPKDLGLDVATFEPNCLKKLTKEKASDIFKRFFWDRYGFAAIIDPTVATKCFDMSVNMGGTASAKCAQRAVNLLIPNKLTVDGGWGKLTFGAINGLDPKQFIKAYSGTLADYYEAIIVARPKNAVFRKNWMRRAKWGM